MRRNCDFIRSWFGILEILVPFFHLPQVPSPTFRPTVMRRYETIQSFQFGQLKSRENRGPILEKSNVATFGCDNFRIERFIERSGYMIEPEKPKFLL
jgi:hypothetical protein